jgi:hypothetical protein
MTTPLVIKRGMRVVWKPEYRAKGDENYTFIAVQDQHPHDGGFGVSTIENTMWIRPIQIGGAAHMVEFAEPYLPVFTLTFMGLEKKGARVRRHRTLGEQELSVDEEVIPRSTFHRIFHRHAKNCKVGQDLGSGIEFPENVVPKELL